MIMLRKEIMNMLVLFFLVNQVLRIFGEVVVVREPKNENSVRKFICSSDDDGSALVWNSYCKFGTPFFCLESTPFYQTTKPNNNKVDCKMEADEKCLLAWDSSLWNFTNSLKTPMGPALDQRWEEFKEYALKNKFEHTINLQNTTAALSFSVRVLTENIDVLICNSKNYDTNPCYWITLNLKSKNKSYIMKCSTGVPTDDFNRKKNSSRCEKVLHASERPFAVPAIVWSSFVITWNSVTGNISIYNPNDIFMSWKDKEKFLPLSTDYYIFFKNFNPFLKTYFRFHIYDFLYTTVDGANLTSPNFLLNNKEICIQMLIGLCASCDAEVLLYNFTNNEILERVKAEGTFKAHDLPMWQSIKIKKNLSTPGYTNVTIRLIPVLKSLDYNNPLWAIANVRQCPPDGSLRWASLTVKETRSYTERIFPQLSCQRLFYEENVFMIPTVPVNPSLKFDCSIRYVGPQCLICSEQLPMNSTCKGTAICYKNGCTCSPDFVGPECNEPCNSTYGYECKKSCGACAHQNTCNNITGECTNIHAVAFNKDVAESSSRASVTEEMLNNTRPDAPRNYTFTLNDHGMVELKWLHSWRTGDHLSRFRLLVQEGRSNLKRNSNWIETRSSRINYWYQVERDKHDYSMRLHLLPSTDYNVSIQSLTMFGVYSGVEFVEFHTPSSVDFSKKLRGHEVNSTILLNIPDVVNDTFGSVLHVIVKGPRPCEQYGILPARLSTQLGMRNTKTDDNVWQAAEDSTSKLANNTLTIGGNNIHGTNCTLKSGEMYVIMVIITEGFNESIILVRNISIAVDYNSPTHYEMWITLLILLLVVGIATFSFYGCRRQKSIHRLMLQDVIDLSHYNFERGEQDTENMNSEQDLSTPSNRQAISWINVPLVPKITSKNDNDEKEMTSLVRVKDFEDYVRRAIHSGLLDKQFETFPTGQTRPWNFAKLPQNKSKNRYANFMAYDNTRVILKKLPYDYYSDYINANYITDFRKEKRYIATQGPKPNTVIDFWRMIWQEKVLIICMIANTIENEKCEQYWPDIDTKKKYGDIFVLNAKHSVFADYTFRTLYVTCGEETRKMKHLHYTAWPDHGVPLYTHSIVMYLKKLLATPPGDGPVVVHCSDGAGRTGTIILCDICLRRAAAERMVDVFAETTSIRRERVNMVENKQQYLLAHLALAECLLSLPTSLPCNKTLPARIREMKKQLPIQQHRLQETAWQDDALRQITTPLPRMSERNRAKNRFPELLSDRISRIYWKRYPLEDEDSDYLSAIYVDGVKLRSQYLATELPMPSTIKNFWRMVAEFKVELILVLQPPDLLDPTCCVIAPTIGEFKPKPYLNITAQKIEKLENYTSQKLLLVDNSETPSRKQSVTILCLTRWKSGRNQSPPPVMDMVTFWQAAEKISRGNGPTITLCYDGVTGCGLYLALSFLLERMAVERECDVCLAVRAVRRSRPDFVQSLRHLEYLYDAATTYLEYFETYANFS